MLLQQETSKKEIAKSINIYYSTVYREIKRSSGKRGYSHAFAHQVTCERQERFSGNRAIPAGIKAEAVKWIRDEQWPATQVAGYLVNKGKRVLYETIYRITSKDKEAGKISMKIASTS